MEWGTMTQGLSAKVAIIGAGWAGLAAAVAATQAGMQVTVYEAAREPGGRARTVYVPATAVGAGAGPLHQTGHALPERLALDNGQHILIGAYRASLDLMRSIGVQPEECLQRLPLDLTDMAGNGLALPNWPSAFQQLGGAWAITQAKGWRWESRWALLRKAVEWQLQGFQAPWTMTVAQLCQRLPAELLKQFVEPLCIAALNTPIEQASAQVFLRVLQDSLAGSPGSSDMLLPTRALGDVLAQPALQWLEQRGAQVVLGQRVDQLVWSAGAGAGAGAGAAPQTGRWQIQGQDFDAVVLACPAWEAARLLARWAQDYAVGANPLDRLEPPQTTSTSDAAPASVQEWLQLAAQLEHESIGTVYLQSKQNFGSSPLPKPMLAVHGGPAQFVFDRQRLTGNKGVTAWVASTLMLDKAALTQAVLQQASQLHALQPGGAAAAEYGFEHLITIVEKRATFRCVAGVERPRLQVDAAWPSLWVCGDYLRGPYPATLEAAVLNGQAAIAQLRTALSCRA